LLLRQGRRVESTPFIYFVLIIVVANSTLNNKQVKLDFCGILGCLLIEKMRKELKEAYCGRKILRFIKELHNK
jgi:hypothetical protein